LFAMQEMAAQAEGEAPDQATRAMAWAIARSAVVTLSRPALDAPAAGEPVD
jgi:hypothetical protein